MKYPLKRRAVSRGCRGSGPPCQVFPGGFGQQACAKERHA
ncbi:hypothetical protein BMF35_a2189 [Aurantiacibacter gangjinensis]|nr:hypothetical protein BMF35_a2189 [Aurantiacibacter gangjinensis]